MPESFVEKTALTSEPEEPPPLGSQIYLVTQPSLVTHLHSYLMTRLERERERDRDTMLLKVTLRQVGGGGPLSPIQS